jgi:hypothetical protein
MANAEQVKKRLEEALNCGGHSFHNAVLKRMGELFDANTSLWYLEATEFPVQAQGSGTRIDFVMKRRGRIEFYLLGECKRANPALSDWCFAKASFVHHERSPGDEPLLLERITKQPGKSPNVASVKSMRLPSAYHLALELKTDLKGDSSGNRGGIEEAATQVCRGLNGMVEALIQHHKYLFTSEPLDIFLLPVIVTTAQLWVTDADLSSTDLATGNIDLSGTGFRQVEWLIYQYPQSPGLKHGYLPDPYPKTLGDSMDAQFIRTIPIVNSTGIEAFLRWASYSVLS